MVNVFRTIKRNCCWSQQLRLHLLVWNALGERLTSQIEDCFLEKTRLAGFFFWSALNKGSQNEGGNSCDVVPKGRTYSYEFCRGVIFFYLKQMILACPRTSRLLS